MILINPREAGFVSSRRWFHGIAKTAAPRAGVRDRGGGRWSGWCKVYPHEDVRAARVRVVKSDNTRATGSGLTALKEAPGAEGGAAASALPRRRARVVAQMATARIPMKMGALFASSRGFDDPIESSQKPTRRR